MRQPLTRVRNPLTLPPVARRQENFPDWWLQLDISDRQREKIRAKFTLHRDGYSIWYRGGKRVFCGKATPPGEVEDRWEARRKEIDQKLDKAPPPFALPNLYRQVLSEFLIVQRARVNAPRNAIAERTYHNYVKALNDFGNFTHDGAKIADTPIRAIGPAHFGAYAATFATWKASGFDSIVTRVGSLFRWAVEMEYIDRYRPGPQFQRPDKGEIRSQRIDLTKSYTVDEVAKLYDAASHTVRCWIALGICAAFNNADIGNLPRSLIDLDTGVIDFRRRKTGKVRRVIPLPPDVVTLLKWYKRPDPIETEWDDLFFVTEYGNPYTRSRSKGGGFNPSNTVSRMFARLLEDTGVSTEGDGRNFSGLRTTHYNLAGKGWDHERMLVMGHAHGRIDLDHYLEEVGVERLREYVQHVWNQIKTAQ